MQTADGGVPDGDRGLSEQLKIRLEPDSQGVRITLVGEVDLATVPELDRLLDDLAEREHRRLLIDLNGVEFMDSTGLASIIRALHTADANGHRLTVRCASPQVQRLFEIAGIIDRLTFEA
ncbi:MAG TPA: STAS domain-containing protein [Solirubrobacteraceae bacterium]|jgi:anti-anti-sigma factor